MPRPMSVARFAKTGMCPMCPVHFAADAAVILTRSGSIVCAGHRELFTLDAVAAEGPYKRVRSMQRADV